MLCVRSHLMPKKFLNPHAFFLMVPPPQGSWEESALSSKVVDTKVGELLWLSAYLS